MFTLNLTLIKNSIVQFAPCCIGTQRSRELTHFSPMSKVSRDSSDAKMTMLSKVYSYFMKLNRHCATWLSFKESLKQSVLQCSSGPSHEEHCQLSQSKCSMSNAKGTTFFIYSICRLLLSQALLTSRFKTHWVCPCANWMMQVPWWQHIKWWSYSCFLRGKSQHERSITHLHVYELLDPHNTLHGYHENLFYSI